MFQSAHALHLCLVAVSVALHGMPIVAAQEPQPLFPPHCRLVLLAGLAGDLESESLFREQLQSWGEIAARSGRVESLYVLCDEPQSVTLPAGIPASRLRVGREAFQELGRRLSAGTNPLVVIAWGHGGRQGSTPVLHVRGPRLTPADFSQFAARAATGHSEWVLMFRGSGCFARQLTGADRQILTSDVDEEPRSDPMGLSLLLKTARSKGVDSFQDLADELGRATQTWYGERHLARTEEPALWNGVERPRLVSGVSTEDSGADSIQESSARNHSAPGINITATEGEATGAWHGLARVRPGDFPHADAVILRQKLSCRVAHDPAVETERDEFIQVLTAQGKRYGDFDVSYWPPQEELEFLDCEVLKPGGQLVRLEPDMIGEAGQPAADDEGPRRKRFSLPDVEPGCILHVHYRSEWKTFPLPEVSMRLPVGGELPALNCAVTVTIPKAVPFHFAFEDTAAADPAVEQTAYGSTFGWQFTNLPASEHEVLQNPYRRPCLAFSTFADWPSFAGWYERITRLTDEVTPEISAKALELTRDAHTEREKVVALYNYVAGLRYVAVPLGINSFRPHAAANVLRNQFGDCKDKANLFNTMLHAIRIEAQLVLVPRFGQAHEFVPGLAFNHALSLLTLGGQRVWADTTDSVCRFGLLPPGDGGRKVLVIGGHSTQLTELPVPDARDQRLTIRGVLDCAAAGDGLPLRLSVQAHGYPDYELRAVAQQFRDAQRSLPLLSISYQPAAGAFSLEEQQHSLVEALNEDFACECRGSAVGLCSSSKEQRRLRAPFWLPKEWDLALHQRHSPLFLNKGYPLTLDEEFEITLPARATTPVLPAVCTDTQGPLRWHIEWATVHHEKLVARFHAVLVPGELSASETTRFQQQLRSLLAALASEASFSVPDQIASH